MQLFEGTSGFSYKEWKGSFYPAKLPANQMLEFYAAQLSAVEINNTFYRMPKRELLESWREKVPTDFRFILKVPKRISHSQRLQDSEDNVDYLVGVAQALGEQRGPFLLQLPPFLRKDTERLAVFLDHWPKTERIAFEFRHPSWFEQDTFEVLRNANAALCIADSGTDKDAPLFATADYGYLRLRREDYTENDVRDWARRAKEQPWRDAFVFFKHEDEGAGPRLALQFKEAFEGS